MIAICFLLFITLFLQPLSAQERANGTSSLGGKVMCGYQGWFGAPGDGSGLGWRHYAGGNREPVPGRCSFDLWPDMSEFTEKEKAPTSFKYPDGSTAHLFSSRNAQTVRRHFKWMKDYGIDGVFLQRFATSIKGVSEREHCDIVLSHVRDAAKIHHRAWAMMYDLSGLKSGEIETVLIPDWKCLVGEKKITEDRAYVYHEGKPLVSIWGVGFNDGRGYSLDECETLIRFLKEQGNAVMLGVPSAWRTLARDSVSDVKLHRMIELADIVSPWSVGRFRSPEQAAAREGQILRPDLEWVSERGKSYLPVIFPGFSWQNLKRMHGEDVALNDIPRLKGQFLWSQALAAKKAGAIMLYVAMFDEIDEATAIFKSSRNPPQEKSRFIDNEEMPADHYLWLTGQIGKMLRGEIPLSDKIPKR